MAGALWGLRLGKQGFPFDLSAVLRIIPASKPTSMAKLVLLSEGFTGRSHELITDRTTIGRVEDNTFPIVDASVSSHHCEILQRGSDIIVKDLNSTNGTFIEGQLISGEGVLKNGQILRLGQIQMRLETGEPPAPAGKKQIDQTMVMQRGISLNDLEQGPRGAGFETTGNAFSKKTNKVNRYFLIGGIILGLIILVGLIMAVSAIKK